MEIFTHPPKKLNKTTKNDSLITAKNVHNLSLSKFIQDKSNFNQN